MIVGIPKEIKNNENRVSSVSYTHLDVYKRQHRAFIIMTGTDKSISQINRNIMKHISVTTLQTIIKC